MIRVVHAQNDLLTPFELRAHNIRVYGSRSTYQNGSLEKKFFRAKNFFRAIFRKKFFFDFLTMMGIKTLLSLS